MIVLATSFVDSSLYIFDVDGLKFLKNDFFSNISMKRKTRYWYLWRVLSDV